MAKHDPWNADQYHRFRQQRSKPFYDLLQMVDRRPGMKVVDLGCGTGELTAELHRSLAAESTLGIDSSPAMLVEARKVEVPGLQFGEADIGTALPPGRFDLIFSNAALHWVPDHVEVLTRLTARLEPGGQLAVQVPANHTEASHTVATAVAATEPFRTALGGYTVPVHVLTPIEYANLLFELGYAEQRVELRVYGHVLENRDAVVEWVKGTLLTAYRQRLDEDLHASFVEEYRARLRQVLADTKPFFFAFSRILLWGQKG